MSAGVNVALRLGRWAAERPHAPAVVHAGRSLSFSALDEEAARLSAGLSGSGVERGGRVALMVPPSFEFYALTFALLRMGAVPVLIDPGLGLSGIGRCLEEAAPSAFIGGPKAHLARALGGWGKKTLKRLVCARGFWPGAAGLSKVRRGAAGLRAPELPGGGETAAILFTSGSTGPAKGVVYTHGMFDAQTEALGALFGVAAGEVSVPTFPLFGLFDVALGMTAVIPDMDFSRPAGVCSEEIVRKVRDFQAAQLFGSPALLDAVGRFCEERGVALTSLKRVMSAGAPVSPKILARWSKIAPQASLFTPYGATEALPVAVIEGRELLERTSSLSAQGKGTCVGKPVCGVEVRVIEICDGAVPQWSEELALEPGRVGEICVSGPVVSERYENRPEQTALAKIRGRDGRLWHRMGDLGCFDEAGRLWFCGRKSQRVVTPAGTLFTDPCEGVFNAHPAVRRSALVGARAAGAVIPVLCVELEKGFDGDAVRPQLLALGGKFPQTRAIKTILFHPGFPVDARHNAKIFREKLAQWAAARIR